MEDTCEVKKWTIALLHGLTTNDHTETEFPTFFAWREIIHEVSARDFFGVPDGVRTKKRCMDTVSNTARVGPKLGSVYVSYRTRQNARSTRSST
jgi:hypothetical protein